MSHELEILENGEASMAYFGEVPWHGLGVQVSNNLSPKEMLKAASLDWKVEKFNNYTDVNGVKVPTGEMSLVRMSDHKVLSPHMGTGWEPLQNEDAFEFFSEFVKAGDMEMHTAGSLFGGQHIWALARVKDGFKAFGTDEVQQHVLLSSPHVFGKSIVADFTAIRVVCNNTLSMALGSQTANAVRVNHRQKFNPEKVKALLGIAHDQLQEYREAAEYLGEKRYSQEQLLEYFAGIFPPTGENKKGAKLSSVGEVAKLKTETQPGADIVPGTWWNAFNAVTYTVDHVMCRDRDTRMFHSWLGSHNLMKRKALMTAIKFAEKE